MSDQAPIAPRQVVGSLRRYASFWLVGGVLAILVAAGLHGAGAPVLLVLFCIGFIVVADATEVRFERGAAGEYLTLLEVGVVTALLVLPMGWVPLTVALAVLVHHGLVRRRDAVKVAFNVGQHAVAATGAALVLAPVHQPGDPVGVVAIVGVLVAMSVYALVNSLAIGGVFARIDGSRLTAVLRSRLTLMASTLLGASVLGVLAVGVWEAAPVLAPLLISPVAALHLAYRGTARSETLLHTVRLERDRLDRVVAGASEGIVLLDADGLIELWNPAMVAITGREEAEVTGRSASEFLIGPDADGTRVDPVMLLANGVGGTFEVRLPTDEEPVAVRMTHTLIIDDDTPVGDVVLVRDLSRERAAHALKEDFVARVSHELRTPLSPIRGYAQTLIRAGDRVSPEMRNEALEHIVERTEHLERLIEDLLLVSRISSGDPGQIEECNPTNLDVEELATRVVTWFKRDHADRAFMVTGKAANTWADPLRVGQVLTNLLANACKYTPAGSPIEVVLADADELVTIAVVDHGPGIPADMHELIFERFQRLDNPQRMTTGGIGLGLCIARDLAAQMEGTLDVVSQRGCGSTFTLSLPRATVERAAAAAALQTRPDWAAV